MKIKGFADTIDWYNRNAHQYASAVADLYSIDDIKEFIAHVQKDSIVLDAGCGSGRDTA